MVQCFAAFMDCCYIARRNAISTSDITKLHYQISCFHQLHTVFIETGVREDFSLPRQHALFHYPDAIEHFGSPNGLCSSITENKHIKAVKETWRRSSWNNVLPQMLRSITCLNKMTVLHQVFKQWGMLVGYVSSYVAACQTGNPPPILPWRAQQDNDELDSNDEEEVWLPPGSHVLASVELARRSRKFSMQPSFRVLTPPRVTISQVPTWTCSIYRPTWLPPCLSPDNVILMTPCLQTSMIALLSRAKSMFFILLLPIFMHPVTCAGQVECSVSIFSQIKAGRVVHAMIQSLLSWMTLSQAWQVCLLPVFNYSSRSLTPYLKTSIPAALVNWFVHYGDKPDTNTGM